MIKMALALEARMRPAGAPLTKVILGDAPTIVIEVDPERCTEDIIFASLESTSFNPRQLSSLLRFVADAIDNGNETGKIESVDEDEDGNETMSPEAIALRDELHRKVDEYNSNDGPDPFDGDGPNSHL